VERLYDIHHFACQHLKVATNWIKDHYDQLANVAGFQEGNRVWLYCPNPEDRKITQAADMLGRSIPQHHPD
jgi:hypothetical protein